MRQDNHKAAMWMTIKMLRAVGAPSVLEQLVFLMYKNNMVSPSSRVTWTEFFAGQQAVTDAFLKKGLVAIPFEIKNNATFQDLLGDLGMIYGMNCILITEDDGGGNTAPVLNTSNQMKPRLLHRVLTHTPSQTKARLYAHVR